MSDAVIEIDDLIHPSGESKDPDYIAWKNAKIKAAMKEAEDRANMVPAEEVWEAFGFER